MFFFAAFKIDGYPIFKPSLFDRFHDLVTGSTSARPDDPALGSLAAFSGVSRFPVRVKCASLAWHALRAALRDEDAAASAEPQ